MNSCVHTNQTNWTLGLSVLRTGPGPLLWKHPESSCLPLRLAKELQEKNRVIQSLQSQLREQGPSSHHSSHSDLYHSDRTSSSSSYSSPMTPGGSRAHSKRNVHKNWILQVKQFNETPHVVFGSTNSNSACFIKNSTLSFSVRGNVSSRLPESLSLCFGRPRRCLYCHLFSTQVHSVAVKRRVEQSMPVEGRAGVQFQSSTT